MWQKLVFSTVCKSYCRTHLMVNLKHACIENFNVDATVCRGAVTSTAVWVYSDLSNFWDMSWDSVWITCILQGNATLQQKTSIVAEIFAARWITKYHMVSMSTNSWQHFTNWLNNETIHAQLPVAQYSFLCQYHNTGKLHKTLKVYITIKKQCSSCN